jgi:hypothetical protein
VGRLARVPLLGDEGGADPVGLGLHDAGLPNADGADHRSSDDAGVGVVGLAMSPLLPVRRMGI